VTVPEGEDGAVLEHPEVIRIGRRSRSAAVRRAMAPVVVVAGECTGTVPFREVVRITSQPNRRRGRCQRDRECTSDGSLTHAAGPGILTVRTCMAAAGPRRAWRTP
jgi:hypothetical protein